MYLLGYHGNNLYPSSLRLFSDKQQLMNYLCDQWQETKNSFHREGRKDAHARSFDTFEGYISMISWRLYEIQLDADLDPRNIRSTTLKKWAKEFEEK